MVFASHPVQYQVPVWRALSENHNLELLVVYGSDFSANQYYDSGFSSAVAWDQPLLEGYEHVVIGHDKKDGFFSITGRGLRGVVRQFKPDVGLVLAYHPLFYMNAIRQLRRVGARVMMRAELTSVDTDRSGPKNYLREKTLRTLYTKIDHFLSIGQNCYRHLRQMSVPEDKISFAGYNVDDRLFINQREHYQGRQSEIRRELQLEPDTFVFIASGKLIAKKDPLLLAEAFQAVCDELGPENVFLIFMGDGELRKEIEKTLGGKLRKRFLITGFVNQAKVGKYYSVADCAVLPSKYGETWGLVVNEAQIFGLPCIVSDRVGCHPDLINAATGRVFAAGDPAALQSAMQEVMPWVKRDRKQIAQATREKARLYTSAKAASAIVESARSLWADR